MADDYEAIARVLRYLNRDPGRLAFIADVRNGTGLRHEELVVALSALQRRRWVTFSGNCMHVGLDGEGVELAGRDAAQLLAGDIAVWATSTKRPSYPIRDLPEDLRFDQELLDAALEELAADGAVQLHKSMCGGSGPETDMFIVLPRLRTYTFGHDRSAKYTSIVQHVAGDVVGGDKNVNSGSGNIVTGDYNVLHASTDPADSFRRFIETLRSEGELDTCALDALAQALTPGHDAPQIAEAVRRSVELEPRLVDKLQGWCASIWTSAAGSLVYEVVKAYLFTKVGWKPG